MLETSTILKFDRSTPRGCIGNSLLPAYEFENRALIIDLLPGEYFM